MANHLFLFTIGPVQSFIAQARKTIDLKAGSDILSELILAAIRLAQTQYQAEVIFPFIPTGNEAQSLPNKFLAQVDINAQDAKAMGVGIETCVRETLEAFAKDAYDELKIRPADAIFQERFMEQIRSHLEVYWVFEPLSSPDNYRQAYKNIESRLSAIKNTRTFDPLPIDESGRKCSVTGERDALIFSANKNFKTPYFIDKSNPKFVHVDAVKLSEREGLSAVVATKRFYSNKPFLSTADIAILTFSEKVKTSPLGFDYGYYKGLYDTKDWDGQLLFPENLTRDYFKKHGLKYEPKEYLKNLQEKLSEIWKKGKAAQLPTRSPYYALLSFDGDSMGRIWSGDAAYLDEAADLKAFQSQLAERLYHFAQKARNFLEGGSEKRGQAVYAGGDDFTGFVNLQYLFEVLQYLRNLYRTEVSQQLPTKMEITFSAGICIAHYKTPLGEVVRSAQKAQDHAKEDAKRNAFCIYLMKRSGEIQRASARWGIPKNELMYLEALRTCVLYQQQGCFSNTFITTINRELMGLLGRSKDFKADFSSIIETELRRLIKRSIIDQGLHQYLQANPQESAQSVMDKMQQAVLLLFRDRTHEHKYQNALHFLEIADFLNRQPDHAN